MLYWIQGKKVRENMAISKYEDMSIFEVLDRINNHTRLLPDIQRDYVWNTEDVENLLASMRLIIINITHRFYKKEKPTVVSIAYGLFEIIKELYSTINQLCEILEPYKTPF